MSQNNSDLALGTSLIKKGEARGLSPALAARLEEPSVAQSVPLHPPFPPDDLDGIESYIRQIHENDPDGQRFRYAKVKGRQGKKSRTQTQARGLSLRPELKLINIRVFAECMERLADYIESVESWFNHLFQAKCEMEMELAEPETDEWQNV